ncbi:MAG: hypothetical protein ABI142_10255, partial [Bryocella sp.]
MPSNSLGDPHSGKDRHVPTRVHAFERNTIDPISTYRRPLFTVGNGLLLVAIIGYGMFATGNLPQLDAFFDSADRYGKAHNSTVVNGLLTYGAYLFFAVIAVLVGLILFAFVNAYRRNITDRDADEIAERRRGPRRNSPPAEGLPSLIMPLGKERPDRRHAEQQTAEPAAATTTPNVASSVIAAVSAEAEPTATLAAA